MNAGLSLRVVATRVEPLVPYGRSPKRLDLDWWIPSILSKLGSDIGEPG